MESIWKICVRDRWRIYGEIGERSVKNIQKICVRDLQNNYGETIGEISGKRSMRRMEDL